MSRPSVNQHLRRNVFGLVFFFALHAVFTGFSANSIDDDHHIAHYVIHISAFAVIVLYYFWVFKPLQNSVCKFFKLQFAVRYATFFNHSFKNQIG